MAFSSVCVAATRSFHDAVRAAWSLDPTQRALNVAEGSADEEAHAARAWFPAGAILNAQYLDDHFIGSNQGYTTYQGQLSLPFWLPGQGSATERNALADADVARANMTMERMAIAIQLLNMTTDAAMQQHNIVALTAEQDAARQMIAVSARMVKVGEESQSDHDAIAGFLDDISQRLAEAQERLAGFQADLRRVTGLDTVPDIEAVDGRDLARAGVSNASLAIERDPRLIYASAVEKAADASFDVTKHSWMPTPSAGIQVIRQKQFEALWDTSVGVQMTIQLPSRAQHTPQLMQKVRQQASAERDLTQARRVVTDEYEHTLNRLHTSLSVMDYARSRCVTLSDREQDVTHAWRVGETPVIEVLRARQATLTACQARDAAIVAWHSALIHLMISSGATP